MQDVALSEERLARMFTAVRGQDFAVIGNQWLVRQRHIWVPDERREVLNAARQLHAHWSDLLLADEQPRAAATVSSYRTLSAVVKIAASDPRHAARAADFDLDGYELNTPGGVIDLRTGVSRPHVAADRHMRSVGVAPGGDCPRWTTFLHEITCGDTEYADWLQRWAGYLLTGVIREQLVLVLSGPGGNGKGVLVQTLADILDSYAVTANPDLLVDTGREEHKTQFAALRGARMISISEVPDGKAWAEQRLKSLSGGDKITGRKMGENFSEWRPTGKLIISCNDKPQLRNVDRAMQRRLQIAPFNFTPQKVDLGLRDALLAEAPGILAWAIRGTAKWYDQSLTMPAAVAEATQAYFDDQDTLGAWLTECTVADRDGKLEASVAFASWSRFADSRNEYPRNQKWFSPALERRGYTKVRNAAGMLFRGLALRDPQDGVLPP